jgi:hypothetical protein
LPGMFSAMFRARARRRAVRAWAEQHAVSLQAHPEALDTALAGKRVLLLGESDHFVHEVHETRLLFLRHLVPRGWTRVGEELGVSDGFRIDRYLETSDETWLERLPSFGYRAALRDDRDDTPRGCLAPAWGDGYPREAMRTERASLARSLRAVGSVRWFGFDMDGAPGGAYEDVQHLGPLPDAVRALLPRVPGESIDEEIARIESGLPPRRRPCPRPRRSGARHGRARGRPCSSRSSACSPRSPATRASCWSATPRTCPRTGPPRTRSRRAPAPRRSRWARAWPAPTPARSSPYGSCTRAP